MAVGTKKKGGVSKSSENIKSVVPATQQASTQFLCSICEDLRQPPLPPVPLVEEEEEDLLPPVPLVVVEEEEVEGLLPPVPPVVVEEEVVVAVNSQVQH